MPEKYKWPTITGLYQPIDYGNIKPFDTTAIRNTMQSMTNLVHALGVKTKEEEEEVERSQQLEKDKKAALEKSSQIWSELGNSENVYDWYNAHQPDPQKQAEFAQQGAATAGYLSAIPLTVFSAGTMGWIPAITSTATGFGGAYLGQKAGEYIDSKTGWNTTPWLTFGGGLFGGIGGYKGLTRLATTKFGSTPIINGKTLFTNNASNTLYGKQFLSDVIADDLVRGTRPWFKDGKQALQLKLDLNNTDRFVQENFVFPEGTKTLIHGDGVATGYNNPAKIPTIGYGAKKMMTDFPHWKYGKLVPAKSEIVQKHGQRISADKHPLYFSDLEPWYELQQDGRTLQTYLNQTKDLRTWYKTHGVKRATEYPFRFMTIDPSDVENLDAGYYSGSRWSNEFEAMSIPMDKIKFSAEYDPILKTWGKTQYIDPSAFVQTIPKTSYRFFERPSTIFKAADDLVEVNGKMVPKWQLPKGERNMRPNQNPINISLVNRSDSFIPVEDGNFVFASPDQAKKLSTIHFTQHVPVTSHSGGNWDHMSTTTLIPYGNVRKVTAPLDIEVMDTFFPNYNGLKVKTNNAKVLTGSRDTYNYYKSHGVDVQFSEELETLRKQFDSIHKEFDDYMRASDYSIDDHAWTLQAQLDDLQTKMRNIHTEWTLKNRIPGTYQDMKRLEQIEGIKTSVEPVIDRSLKTPIQKQLGFTYYSTPQSHSAYEFIRPGDDIYQNLNPWQKKFVDWRVQHKSDYR